MSLAFKERLSAEDALSFNNSTKLQRQNAKKLIDDDILAFNSIPQNQRGRFLDYKTALIYNDIYNNEPGVQPPSSIGYDKCGACITPRNCDVCPLKKLNDKEPDGDG
jgi:hypothetical protein